VFYDAIRFVVVSSVDLDTCPVFLDPIANPVSPETLKRWSEQVSKSTDDTTTKRIAS
jgi:hypothetical protein